MGLVFLHLSVHQIRLFMFVNILLLLFLQVVPIIVQAMEFVSISPIVLELINKIEIIMVMMLQNILTLVDQISILVKNTTITQLVLAIMVIQELTVEILTTDSLHLPPLQVESSQQL